ncbi:3530_t:CDS:2 [Diversispora eburnea]|uniref:3530_t:CDS:1 n=1 Tax=Diversispora eburnea TaxID=1213867 RepID=A0A9N9AQH7_9GLOM|nr:3530_t:CDS:2 [Diversispora eburnea]
MKLSTLLCLTLLIIGIMTLPDPCNEIEERGERGGRKGQGQFIKRNECDGFFKRDGAADTEDTEDYMSSKFLTESSSSSQKIQTYSERRRKKLEKSNIEGYIKPRHEIEEEKRIQGLSKRIDNEDNESPGLKLLIKMGYEKGKSLGKDQNNNSGLIEPLDIEIKKGAELYCNVFVLWNRYGIGMSTEIKRKAQTELIKAVKREKIEEETFIQRMSQESVNKRIEQQLNTIRRGIENNVFWLHIENEEQEIEEIENEEEEFEKLETNEKLDIILTYLRNRYHYCFWCGSDYDSAEELLRECPGTKEEDHE